ncbi:fasciclin domain-containing protein [Alkalicaulis satelles]|uniref:Fasciclin domain-containing protein n=1 Tax=Alkalicaulis satelles TaxID=2609175 RepID=A0A5M6Z9F0_9PROT|nr:fasciclin domain-containing protein [Alkalicaulis satelles]KAA5800965.1 fasciclin domain-containing protein [Alkalicaulis satelles]
MRISTLLASSVLAFGAVGAAAVADHHGDGYSAEAQPTIVEIASADDTFSTLVAAVTAADLADALAGEGPFTVFAPTNDAFDALPEGTVESLLEEGNRDQLTAVLTYHVVSGRYLAAETPAGTYELPTLQGSTVTVVIGEDGAVTVDGANVISADIEASNGVIHVIDAVILP